MITVTEGNKKAEITIKNIFNFNLEILEVFIYKLSTLNLIYRYDIKLNYFYINHDFFNTFSIFNINF